MKRIENIESIFKLKFASFAVVENDGNECKKRIQLHPVGDSAKQKQSQGKRDNFKPLIFRDKSKPRNKHPIKAVLKGHAHLRKESPHHYVKNPEKYKGQWDKLLILHGILGYINKQDRHGERQKDIELSPAANKRNRLTKSSKEKDFEKMTALVFGIGASLGNQKCKYRHCQPSDNSHRVVIVKQHKTDMVNEHGYYRQKLQHIGGHKPFFEEIDTHKAVLSDVFAKGGCRHLPSVISRDSAYILISIYYLPS